MRGAQLTNEKWSYENANDFSFPEFSFFFFLQQHSDKETLPDCFQLRYFIGKTMPFIGYRLTDWWRDRRWWRHQTNKPSRKMRTASRKFSSENCQNSEVVCSALCWFISYVFFHHKGWLKPLAEQVCSQAFVDYAAARKTTQPCDDKPPGVKILDKEKSWPGHVRSTCPHRSQSCSLHLMLTVEGIFQKLKLRAGEVVSLRSLEN